jgi:murein DD-endopeptidase MepM/ murein hydrolase activator NlpD
VAFSGDADLSRGVGERARDSIPVIDVVLDPTAPPSAQLPEIPRRFSPRQQALLGGGIGLLLIAAIFAAVIGSDAQRRDHIARIFARHPSSPTGVSPAPASETAPAATAVSANGPASGTSETRESDPPFAKIFRVTDLASTPDIKMAEASVDRRTLTDALTQSGIPRNQIYRLLAAFKGLHDFDKTKRHDSFVAALHAPTGRVRAFEYAVGPTEIYQAREREDGSLLAERLDLHVEKRRALAAVVLGDDVGKSLEAAGLDRSLVEWLDEALEGRADLSRMRPGSRLRIVADYETALQSFAHYVDVPAIEYTPTDAESPPVRVYHFHEDKAQGYFDAAGRQPYKGAFRTPIAFARITSRFNMRRMHPILHVIMPHNGVDFAASSGTPVYAAAPGRVESVGEAGASGNLVTIAHAGGITTGYAHLSRFAPHLATGQNVEMRQLIGYVGSTGRSTGPHLHFSVKKNGVFVDPLRLKLDGERELPAAERAEFDHQRMPLDQVLDAIALPEATGATNTVSASGEGEDLEPLDEPEHTP